MAGWNKIPKHNKYFKMEEQAVVVQVDSTDHTLHIVDIAPLGADEAGAVPAGSSPER